MSPVETIVTSILCSVIASFIFLFAILFLFKPKIEVSSFICKGELPLEPGTNYFFIKIVNKSIFSAYDIRVDIHRVRKYPTPPTGMTNNRLIPLTMVLNNLSHLGPYRPLWWRKDAAHCYRLRSAEDLEAIINDDSQAVRLVISAKHGLTGLTKVCEQEYSHPSQLKVGTFTYGTKIALL